MQETMLRNEKQFILNTNKFLFQMPLIQTNVIFELFLKESK